MPDHKEIRILIGFITQLVFNAKESGDTVSTAVGEMALQWCIDNKVLGDTVITPSLLLRLKEESEKSCLETFFKGE